MGFKRSPPPFLAVVNKTNRQVFRGLLGVNFASAGSGILDTTVRATLTRVCDRSPEYVDYCAWITHHSLFVCRGAPSSR